MPQRHRGHLKMRSGCVAQASSKLIFLLVVSLVLKLDVGATYHVGLLMCTSVSLSISPQGQSKAKAPIPCWELHSKF